MRAKNNSVDSIEQYLEEVGRQRHSRFGRRFRQQFRDTRGTAELAMLAAPSEAEYEDFCRVVAAMNEQEKSAPEQMTDEAVRQLARRAGAEVGHTAIFINGYALQKERKRTQKNAKERKGTQT